MTETTTEEGDAAVPRPNAKRSNPRLNTVLTLIPKLSPGTPKGNVVVGLSYLLMLWVVAARVIIQL